MSYLYLNNSINSDSEKNTFFSSTKNLSIKLEPFLANNNDKSKNNKKVPQFILGKKLGQGTFATVRLATHIKTNEIVAMKILDKDKLKEINKIRLEKEIKILKQVRHRNIVHLYSVINSDKVIYIIMEYVKGIELFSYINERKRLSEAESCHFYQQIISGIEYLEKLKIVHRDIKPENIIIEEKKKIKIVDFGLSNIYPENNILFSSCGSPCYAPPEMVEGKKYTGSGVDIWSSGIVLFAMLCGYLPFSDPDEQKLYKKIIEAKLHFPHYLSEQAKDLLTKILNKNPSKRITISKIKRHPWFNITNPKITMSPGFISKEIVTPIDLDIISIMVKEYDYNEKEIKIDLLKNKHNYTTTTYYLLLDAKIRKGENSIADMKSKEYFDYVNDPHNFLSNYNYDIEKVIDERVYNNGNERTFFYKLKLEKKNNTCRQTPKNLTLKIKKIKLEKIKGKKNLGKKVKTECNIMNNKIELENDKINEFYDIDNKEEYICDNDNDNIYNGNYINNVEMFKVNNDKNDNNENNDINKKQNISRNDNNLKLKQKIKVRNLSQVIRNKKNKYLNNTTYFKNPKRNFFLNNESIENKIDSKNKFKNNNTINNNRSINNNMSININILKDNNNIFKEKIKKETILNNNKLKNKIYTRNNKSSSKTKYDEYKNMTISINKKNIINKINIIEEQDKDKNKDKYKNTNSNTSIKKKNDKIKVNNNYYSNANNYNEKKISKKNIMIKKIEPNTFMVKKVSKNKLIGISDKRSPYRYKKNLTHKNPERNEILNIKEINNKNDINANSNKEKLDTLKKTKLNNTLNETKDKQRSSQKILIKKKLFVKLKKPRESYLSCEKKNLIKEPIYNYNTVEKQKVDIDKSYYINLNNSINSYNNSEEYKQNISHDTNFCLRKNEDQNFYKKLKTIDLKIKELGKKNNKEIKERAESVKERNIIRDEINRNNKRNNTNLYNFKNNIKENNSKDKLKKIKINKKYYTNNKSNINNYNINIYNNNNNSNKHANSNIKYINHYEKKNIVKKLDKEFGIENDIYINENAINNNNNINTNNIIDKEINSKFCENYIIKKMGSFNDNKYILKKSDKKLNLKNNNIKGYIPFNLNTIFLSSDIDEIYLIINKYFKLIKIKYMKQKNKYICFIKENKFEIEVDKIEEFNSLYHFKITINNNDNKILKNLIDDIIINLINNIIINKIS